MDKPAKRIEVLEESQTIAMAKASRQLKSQGYDVVNLSSLGTNSAEWQDRVNAEEEDLWRVTSTGSVGGATRKVVALISRKTNPPQVKARWTDEESP